MREISGISGISLALVLALSGCSETAQPESLPTPTAAGAPSSSVQPTDTPSTPTPTPSAGPETPTAQAIRALEAYFASANATARGGNAAKHERRYSSSCRACVDATTDFATAQSNGLAADSDRFASWTTDVQDTSTGQVVVLAVIDFAPVNLVDSAGQVVDAVPGWKNAAFVWTLNEQPNGDWLIVQGEELS